MTTYAVWHKNLNPAGGNFMDNSPADLAKFPTGWRRVAWVTPGPDSDPFTLTNHIDHDWRDNPEVHVLSDFRAPNGVRSTSVGDVIVDHGDKPYDTLGAIVVRRSVDGLGFTDF